MCEAQQKHFASRLYCGREVKFLEKFKIKLEKTGTDEWKFWKNIKRQNILNGVMKLYFRMRNRICLTQKQNCEYNKYKLMTEVRLITYEENCVDSEF